MLKRYFVLAGVIFVLLFAINSSLSLAGTLSEDVEQFFRENPAGFAAVCRNIAAYYHKQASWEKALGWTERILAVQPRNYPALIYKAQLLFSLGRYDQTEQLLKRLEAEPQLKNSPLLVSVRNLLYQTYKKAKKLSQKQKEIRKKLKAKKIDLDTYRQAFMVFRAAEDYNEVIKYAKKAIEAYPEESSFGFALAYAYGQKNKIGRALDAYNDLIKKYPNNPRPYDLLLNLLKEKKLLKKARKLWEDFVSQDPKNLYKRFQLVDILYTLKDKPALSAQLDFIQRDYSSNRQVLTQVMRYRQAIQAEKQKGK